MNMANKVMAPNEALGNFYPGGPLPKRPFVPYKSGKPHQFKDFDALYDEFFDKVENEVVSAVRTPWDTLTKEFAIDFRKGLRAEVKSPSDATSENVPVEFANDLDDLPGSVAVQLSLDPVKWFSNPQKEVKGFVNDLIKGTFGYDVSKNSWNFSDLESNIEQDFIWDPLVKGKNVGVGRLSSSGKTANFLENLVEARMTGAMPILGASAGLGILDTGPTPLANFKSMEDSYILGSGRLITPKNPISDTQSIFINNIGKLKSNGSREGSISSIYMGLLGVLDKEQHRDKDVSYILSPEFTKLMNDRIVVDSQGTQSHLLDLQENDALTGHTNNLKAAIADATKIIAKARSLTLAEKDSLVSVSFLSPVDRETLLNKMRADGVKEKDIIKLAGLSENIDDISDVLLGKGKNVGLVSKITDAIDTSGVTEAVLTDLSTQLKSFSADRATLISKVASGDVSKVLTITRNTIKTTGVDLVNSEGFAYREQFNYLSDMHSFSEGLSKKLKGMSKRNYDVADITKDIDGIKALCDANTKKYTDLEALFKKDPKALEEFQLIFKKHKDAIAKCRTDADKISGAKDAKLFLKKHMSVYNTATIGGGVQDVATRRFMEGVFVKKDSALARSYRLGMTSDTFENEKRLFFISRRRYENETAKALINMIEGGPKELIRPFVQKFVKERFGFRHFDIDKPLQTVVRHVLEDTHYFGLKYDADLAETLKPGSIPAWVEKNIGQRMVAFGGLGLNVFDIKDIGFSAFRVNGGDHLKIAVVLGQLLQNKTLDAVRLGGALPQLGALLNASVQADSLVNKLLARRLRTLSTAVVTEEERFKIMLHVLDKIPALKGVNIGLGDKDKLRAFISETAVFKEWLKKNPLGIKAATALGITFDAAGNMIAKDAFASIGNFFQRISFLKHLPAALDPTQYYVGALRKVSSFLSNIQGKWFIVISNITKPLVMVKTLFSEGLTEGIMLGLDLATGWFAEIFRIVIRAVVYKVVDLGQVLLKGLTKFDLTEFFQEASALISGGIKFMLYFIVVPFIIFFMLFDPMPTLLASVSPVDNSRTDGVLLSDCNEIESRGSGVGTCGICGPVGTVDWTPYTTGSATFTDGIAFVLNAAAKDFNIPSPALATLFYIEGWSENVGGKFEETWTKSNVCDWSLEEGPLLPGCQTRVTSSSGAMGPYQWLKDPFDGNMNKAKDKTPLPRTAYDRCNFLDATYAAASYIKDLGDVVGANSCDSSWTSPIGTTSRAPYVDDLPSNTPKIQWVLLHYYCGVNSSYCVGTSGIGKDYIDKGLAVFNSLKCF